MLLTTYIIGNVINSQPPEVIYLVLQQEITNTKNSTILKKNVSSFFNKC